MAEDILAKYPVKDVHAWYGRLAQGQLKNATSANLPKPMAGLFLLHYIGKNGNKPGDSLKLQAPEHLKKDPSVTSVLAFHRKVFLTEEKGNFGETKDFFAKPIQRWVGLIPRLKDKRWDGKSAIKLEYTSLSDIAPDTMAIVSLQRRQNPNELDIFTSLRGWQLKSDVQVSGALGKNGLTEVGFSSWTASGTDLYDFNKDEYLTLPNPDFTSKEKYAIAPDRKEIRVYHKNAMRMEVEGVAKPFAVELLPWTVADPALLANAVIDPNKKLP
jgi:hypothetical protein